MPLPHDHPRIFSDNNVNDYFLLLPIDPVDPIPSCPNNISSSVCSILDHNLYSCPCLAPMLPSSPDPMTTSPPSNSGADTEGLSSPPASSPTSLSSPDLLSSLNPTRWDDAARKKHSSACAGKTRLSLQDKLDIVCLYYSAPSSPSSDGRRAVSQWDIARMYGKSRAAISKLLKPEYAREIMKAREGLLVKNRAEVLEGIESARRRSA